MVFLQQKTNYQYQLGWTIFLKESTDIFLFNLALFCDVWVLRRTTSSFEEETTGSSVFILVACELNNVEDRSLFTVADSFHLPTLFKPSVEELLVSCSFSSISLAR